MERVHLSLLMCVPQWPPYIIGVMTFAYTLIVRLPTNRRLGYDDTEMEFTWLDRTVSVKPMGSAAVIHEAEWSSLHLLASRTSRAQRRMAALCEATSGWQL